MNMKFPVIDFLITSGVEHCLENNDQFASEIDLAVKKYRNADWGDTCESDWKMNDHAIETGDDRVVAKYKTCEGDIFIITEYGFKITTILFTHEY